MLQQYHRQTRLKTFGPILRDQCDKRWKIENSLQWNLSLLSISSSSSSSDEDEEQFPIRNCSSSSSQESLKSISIEENEFTDKSYHLDPYIIHKHIFGINSSQSNLLNSDADRTAKELYHESQSSINWQKDEFDPRAIRPPPYSEHIEKIKKSSQPVRIQRKSSARLFVRSTRAQSLKLERLKSAREIPQSNEPMKVRPFTGLPRTVEPRISQFIRHSAHPLLSTRISRSYASTDNGDNQSLSTRSCKIALQTNEPLNLSKLLITQMHQDIRSNRVPAYSKALNSALLREQPNPVINRRYKMNRVRQWLNGIEPTDYVEFNEFASHRTTAGTSWNDKLDDEVDLLSEEKQKPGIDRTVAEAHRVLPLFKAEIQRKTRQRDLVLTRIELDLYAV